MTKPDDMMSDVSVIVIFLCIVTVVIGLPVYNYLNSIEREVQGSVIALQHVPDTRNSEIVMTVNADGGFSPAVVPSGGPEQWEIIIKYENVVKALNIDPNIWSEIKVGDDIPLIERTSGFSIKSIRLK